MLPTRSIEGLFTVDVRVPAGEFTPEASAAMLPAKPGVLRVLDHAGGLIQLVATADLRAAAVKRIKRMKDEPEAAGVRLSAAPLGDLLEAEMVWFELARDAAPGEHASAVERHRTWWAVIEPAAHTPYWRRRTLGDRDAFAGDSVFLGPMATKSAADRYCRALDERFGLCREPAILAARPATACVYKEMGACPAPCDGSEPMETFLERVEASARFTPAAAGLELSGINDEMAAAARDMDFELAATLKVSAEVLELFTDPAARHAGSLGAFALVVVVPAGRAGWARIIAAGVPTAEFIADVAVPKGRAAGDAWLAETLAASPAWARVTGAVQEGQSEPTPESLERFELFCHHLVRGGKKARAAVLRVATPIDLADSADLKALAAACRSAARPPKPAAAKADAPTDQAANPTTAQ